MPSPEDIFEALEGDRAQRELEIRLIDNLSKNARTEHEAQSLRRSLTMLTYAHLEGFCKFSLTAYKDAVNSVSILCSEAITPLVAASLNSVFLALRDVNRKDPVFSRDLPDDRDLHLLWRERTFIENYREVVSGMVDIPDKVVDTKSNLNSTVLKRNLYLLGLPHPNIEAHESTINELLGRRNAIAHGDRITYPTPENVRRYQDSAFEVMRFVQSEVYEALRAETYRARAA